ncbi:MAG: inositol-3-phosphate synthase [Gemmataceae bacterium]
MAERRVGLWLIGAFGGVGTTTAVGLSALARDAAQPIGMVTALPQFQKCDWDTLDQFVVGGHDIRNGSFLSTARELQRRAGVFSNEMLTACEADLNSWSANVKPGVIYRPNDAIAQMADRRDVRLAPDPIAAIQQIQQDLREFESDHNLDQIVVINVASTEPPFPIGDDHQTMAGLERILDRPNPPPLPTSSIYAYAAIDALYPYVNITPSLGASFPAMEELARLRGTPHAGQDAKTGETLLKSVLAPMFAKRNLKVLSWVGHNILGNRDGLVLSDPMNKASKIQSKEGLLAELLGYRPQSHVSIEYIESLDDWKTAWDHIHFEGFLGTKMTLQFTWQGCDSILAAPLVLDLARLALRAQRRGQSGALTPLSCFFKSPIGVKEHDFGRQFELLEQYLKK